MLPLIDVRINAVVFALTLAALAAHALPVAGADIEGEVRAGVRPGLERAAMVQLLDGSRIVKVTNTGFDGRFEFFDIREKDYKVRVTYPGFTVAEAPVSFQPGRNRAQVQITLKPDESSAPSAEVIAADELNIPKAANKEYEKGLQYRKKNDCGKAVPHLKKALSLYDRFGGAHYELGNCLRQLGQLDAAESHLRKGIQHSSKINSAVSLTNLLVSARRFEEARQVVEQSIRSHPTEGDLFFALARVYFEQGKLRDAEVAALQAHSIGHRLPDVHLLLARIYVDSKNRSAAVTQLETYLVENPSGPAAEQVRTSLSDLKEELQ